MIAAARHRKMAVGGLFVRYNSSMDSNAALPRSLGPARYRISTSVRLWTRLLGE
jgi:hypothetical protein